MFTFALINIALDAAALAVFTLVMTRPGLGRARRIAPAIRFVEAPSPRPRAGRRPSRAS
jgi:hypothetical protein